MPDDPVVHTPEHSSIADAAALATFVGRRARETWEEHEKPYHLSFVATDLSKIGVNYKLLIAPMRLREWALQADVPDTLVVADPIHKARVLFIPADKEFSLSEADMHVDHAIKPVVHPKQSLIQRRGFRLLRFAEELATVESEQLKSMQVPANVLVALYQAE